MQPSVLLLLAAVLVLAAVAALLGFTGRRRYARRYRVVALLGAAVLAPFLVVVLARQRHAAEDLARQGVPPHPATRHARGLPLSNGDGGSWAFTVAAPAAAVRGFYLDSLPARGWRATLIHPGMLFFERDGRELAVRLRASRGVTEVDLLIERMDGAPPTPEREPGRHGAAAPHAGAPSAPERGPGNIDGPAAVLR